jgi:hypothetical protein
VGELVRSVLFELGRLTVFIQWLFYLFTRPMRDDRAPYVHIIAEVGGR